ncbi:heme exporter protein D [Franzmannia pantelleriensis]|uniref:Heme exporter protein D n=1 Tax=Franzmannia pantelleriensis TaxID=48727 RepID=A0A1G9Q8Q5_9GAMM|nr:heme exporter protein CcmD [Halomonas pantelleriensis]SDM07101.1 heme exporter protein D [Halomonas pantelleriensis]
MAFVSLQDFFAMGGHAPYVWSAWAMTALLLLGSVVHARVERRQLIRDLQRRERRERRVGSEPARNLADDT